MRDYQKLILGAGSLATFLVVPNLPWIAVPSDEREFTVPEGTSVLMYQTSDKELELIQSVESDRDIQFYKLKGLTISPDELERCCRTNYKEYGEEDYKRIVSLVPGESDYKILRGCMVTRDGILYVRQVPGYIDGSRDTTYVDQLEQHLATLDINWNECRFSIPEALNHAKRVWDKPELCSVWGNFQVGSKRISMVAVKRKDVPEEHEYPLSVTLWCHDLKAGTVLEEKKHLVGLWSQSLNKEDLISSLENLLRKETVVLPPTDRQNDTVTLTNGVRLSNNIGRIECHVPGNRLFTRDTGFPKKTSEDYGTWVDANFDVSGIQKPKYLDPVDYEAGHTDPYDPPFRSNTYIGDLDSFMGLDTPVPGFDDDLQDPRWNHKVESALMKSKLKTKIAQVGLVGFVRLALNATSPDSDIFKTKFNCQGKVVSCVFIQEKNNPNALWSVGVYIDRTDDTKLWSIYHCTEDLAKGLVALIVYESYHIDTIKQFSLTNNIGYISLDGPMGRLVPPSA